jgi:predicted amidohydrolase YtcJ
MRHADLLVLGSIATGNSTNPTAEAMAVKDGRIIGIGSLSDIESLTGPDTEIITQRDGVITPGFIEPHMHLWSSVLADAWLDCSQLQNPTFNDVVARLKASAESTPEGDWVLGQLFDPSLFPGEPDLTTDILDAVSTTHPIAVLNASMHFLYVNSKAFELADITVDTPDPDGGKYYRENGKLTGVVGEAGAILKFLAVMPQRSQEDLVNGLRAIMQRAASVGVTSMREAFTGAIMGPGEVSLLHQMNAAAKLPVRISTAQSSLLGAQAWQDAGVWPNSGDDMVRAIAWKVVSDGSNQGRSGFMREPYVGQPDNRGEANFDEPTLVEYLRTGHEGGWQIMLHCNGDAAMDRGVLAYETILDGVPQHDLRHRIEHCSLAHAEHLQRMVRIGVSPSFLMNHVYYWGKALRDDILGPERANHLDPVDSALAAGLRVSLHSDFSVSPMEPLVAARTAVQRKMRDGGEVLNAAERVTPDAALRAVTVDAAWQVHADDAGSLEVGKRADWAVLSDNPWTADPETWADIKTYETRLDGEVAWSA